MNGLDWLKSVGVVVEDDFGVVLAIDAKGLRDIDARRLLFSRCIEEQRPHWLTDADTLIREPGELPQDALEAACTLGLEEGEAWVAVRQVHGKIDLAERQRIGSLGEAGLVRLLEGIWPGSTQHIALEHDGFGYDVGLTLPASSWRLEVKATSRRGRLVVHLSRHEYEVGRTDPSWRLVVVGLDEHGELCAVATVDFDQVLARTPREVTPLATWQALRLELRPADLAPGLGFLKTAPTPPHVGALLSSGVVGEDATFAWMPRHHGELPGGSPAPDSR